MKKIGQALHVGPGNRIIAKIDFLPKIGSTVFDIKKRPIGVVLDIFGPVKSPYMEVEVVGDIDPNKIVNSPLYVLPKPKQLKGKDKYERRG
ncbi:MAG: Gar1/Naf1 family protein [Candidatus Bathyarchaeia archaeon]